MIAPNAILKCPNLREIVFEESNNIFGINENAFSNCPKLESITLPRNFTFYPLHLHFGPDHYYELKIDKRSIVYDCIMNSPKGQEMYQEALARNYIYDVIGI